MRRIIARVMGLTLMAAMLTTAVATQPAVAGSGISVKLVKGGLNDPAGFTFGPGGIIYYAERGTGRILTLNPANGKQHLVFTIPGVNGDGERGALGIALHPRWPAIPYIYVYVTRQFGTSPNVYYRNQLLQDPCGERPRDGVPDPLAVAGVLGDLPQRRPHPVRAGRSPLRLHR